MVNIFISELLIMRVKMNITGVVTEFSIFTWTLDQNNLELEDQKSPNYTRERTLFFSRYSMYLAILKYFVNTQMFSFLEILPK